MPRAIILCNQVPDAVKEYDIETHELPTFLFIEVGQNVQIGLVINGLSISLFKI